MTSSSTEVANSNCRFAASKALILAIRTFGGDRGDGKRSAFWGYIEELAGVRGHADRAEALTDYCTGLLMPVERKSVESTATMVSPSRASSAHESLLHFVARSGLV